ncbi:hypothetical protein LJB42_003836 [Komagataella kurtzmanii]|nr:hypothetical protein LJB42_003836 [Komagataella kurtzmanii]
MSTQKPVGILTSTNINDAGTPSHVVASKLNGDLLLYQIEDMDTPSNQITLDTGVLSSCWHPTSNTKAYTGHLDGNILEIDLEKSIVNLTNSSHMLGVRKLIFLDENQILSGSWDKSLALTDIRSPLNHKYRVGLPGKVLAMDSSFNGYETVVSMTDRIIHVYDKRDFSKPVNVRESGLRYQVRDLKILPNRKGYATCSIEGKASIEYFSEHDLHLNYAFKCHRTPQEEADLVSPVNCIQFDEKERLFTGGSDCRICEWDYHQKKRLKQFSKEPWSVLTMSIREKYLVYGVSDDGYKNMVSERRQYSVEGSLVGLKILE